MSALMLGERSVELLAEKREMRLEMLTVPLMEML